MHEEYTLALFFADYPDAGTIAVPDSGLSFDRGPQTCPYSVPDGTGCSSAGFATTVTAGAATKTAPCREPIGGFIVSSRFPGRRRRAEELPRETRLL